MFVLVPTPHVAEQSPRTHSSHLQWTAEEHFYKVFEVIIMRMIKIHRFVVELSTLTFWYFEEFPVIILHICQDMVKAKKAFVSFKIV